MFICLIIPPWYNESLLHPFALMDTFFILLRFSTPCLGSGCFHQGTSLHGHISHSIWVPTPIPRFPTCEYPSTLLSLLVRATETPFYAPAMCVCPQCCAEPFGFRTTLSRKEKKGKGRGGWKEREKKEIKWGEVNGRREIEKEKEEPVHFWNWWMLIAFLPNRLTNQLSFITCSLG